MRTVVTLKGDDDDQHVLRLADPARSWWMMSGVFPKLWTPI